MARFRSKPCPGLTIVANPGAGEVCENTLGERELPRVRTDTAAGKCGVKDQVSIRNPLNWELYR